MSESITLQSADREFEVFVARPEGEPIGGLVLIHEIWGLVDHIRDVAERWAAEGWLVAAPDILSEAGVTPELGAELQALTANPDEQVRLEAQPRMRDAFSASHAPEYAQWAVHALRTTLDWLEANPGIEDRLVVTGFCFGGTYAFALAAADDRVKAAVPFYGSAPEPDDIVRIQSAVLAIYGQHDPRLIEALPEVTRRMADAGVDFDAVVYPDASHAFFNDTGSRYRADDAADAWRRATAFARSHVESA